MMTRTKFSFQHFKLGLATALAIFSFTKSEAAPSLHGETVAVGGSPDISKLSHPKGYFSLTSGERLEAHSIQTLDLSNLFVQRPPLRSRAGRVTFVPPPPPVEDAPSGRRRGGASRCFECKNNYVPLTALVPGTNSKSALALTVSEYPTFWFYLPYGLTPERTVEFVLQDAADNYIYKTTFTKSSDSAPSLQSGYFSLTAPEIPSGIISLPIPSTAKPLEIGKRYYWSLSIKDKSNEFVFVQGFVQKVALKPTLMNQLKMASPRSRTALYASKGIWHEALTTLGELRRTNPQDAMLTAEWIELLQSVGLEDIAKSPVTDCCTSKKH